MSDEKVLHDTSLQEEQAGDITEMTENHDEDVSRLDDQQAEDAVAPVEPPKGVVGSPPLSPPATASPPPSATFKKPSQPWRGQQPFASTAASRNREAAARRIDVPDVHDRSPLSSPALSNRSFRREPTIPVPDGHYMSSTFASRQKLWTSKEGPLQPEGEKPLWR